MNIDETWGHGQTVSINFTAACTGQAGTDFGDDPVADRDIGHSGRGSGAVNKGCIADH
jgi:hypothetical protein